MSNRMKDKEIAAIAIRIRPFITPIIEAKGCLDVADIQRLCREHGGHNIRSERSCAIIDAALCDM